MRKGDLKKQAILEAAERFFCVKGYEQTGIQDIMDETHVSKGGFYHYFVSKEALLSELCVSHAQAAVEETTKQLAEVTDPVARLNVVLSNAMPITGESKKFLLMILPVIAKPEGFSVVMRWQQALIDAFQPLLAQEIATGKQQGVLYPVCQDPSGAILVMLGQCWREAMGLIIEALKTPGTALNTAALADKIGSYRKIITAVLDAPYGSVELADISAWALLLEDVLQARKHTILLGG